ncbi:hypothetical protein [Clostridium senegalense]|uniref:hypothetical protein n=1 Tax=Clostridium senegalense TaxID=1465809 RepID=UPI000288CB12|nr:hypothetical protein [Clostridium senegalense]
MKIYKDIIEYNIIDDVEVSEEKLGYRIFLKGKIQSFVIEFGECEDINKFISYINNKNNCNKIVSENIYYNHNKTSMLYYF